MRLFDRLRALARDLWLRDNWSAELLSAMAAAGYCAISLAMRAPDQPGFGFVAALLSRQGMPHAYAALQWFGLVIGCGQIGALLLAQSPHGMGWARGITMTATSWLLTGITLGALLTRPEPGIAFAAMCLAANLYGLAKLLRRAG